MQQSDIKEVVELNATRKEWIKMPDIKMLKDKITDSGMTVKAVA